MVRNREDEAWLLDLEPDGGYALLVSEHWYFSGNPADMHSRMDHCGWIAAPVLYAVGERRTADEE